MGSVATLPLNIVVDVVIQITPQAPATPQFNQALIVGTSTVIPSQGGTNPRIRSYTTLAAILADGFTLTSPEYVAAQTYFGQNANGPAPQYLSIGRQDLTALSAATGQVIIHSGNAGTLYAVGDIANIVQSGASLGRVKILTVSTGGVPTSIQVVEGQQGTGYSPATALATNAVTGVGTGLEVDIISVGESALEAVQACRAASAAWWAFAALAAVKADHEAIAAWAQGQIPSCCYFYTTADADALSGATGNVLSFMSQSNYNRVFGIYSTTQGGLAPNNIYAAVACMGVAMGMNTGLANSYFTMKFKELVGIITEPLSQTQIGIIEGNNGNLYLSYANTYEWVEQGVVGNGQFFDEVLNLDMLASDIQFAGVNLLTQSPSIPQTDAGQTQIINAINQGGNNAVNRGFLAPGTWQGITVLGITAGTPIPLGYLTVSPKFSTQSTADRQARKSMPVYMLITEAGAVHSILIGVYVQR